MREGPGGAPGSIQENRRDRLSAWEGSSMAWGPLLHLSKGFFRRTERQIAGHCPRPGQCVQGLRDSGSRILCPPPGATTSWLPWAMSTPMGFPHNTNISWLCGSRHQAEPCGIPCFDGPGEAPGQEARAWSTDRRPGAVRAVHSPCRASCHPTG